MKVKPLKGFRLIYTTDIGAATKWLDATYGHDGKKISTLAYMHHGGGDYKSPLIEGTVPGGGDIGISVDDAKCYSNGSAGCNGAYTLAQFEIWNKYLTDDANVVFGACYAGLGDPVCSEVSNIIGQDKHLNIYFNTSKTADPGSYTGQTAVFIRTGETANYYKGTPYTWNKYTNGENGYKLDEQNLNMILRLHGGVETQKKPQ